MTRPYDDIEQAAKAASGDREERMRFVVDLLWERLKDHGVSWVGCYLPEGESEMVLGPSRDKPACSPIGMHGACGQAFRSGRSLVVRDVAELGENYIACDPRDVAEAVLPVFEDGMCWGVLDVDSFERGAFDESDVAGLTRVLVAAGLTG
jgi:putative methionine-R-sulfoxide reductase with GAF domain